MGFELVIFTDQNYSESDFDCVTFPVKVLDSVYPLWPMVTLMRYSELIRHWDEISGQTVIWLDADMRIQESFNLEIFADRLKFARHPGFIFNFSRYLRLSLGDKKDLLVRALTRIKRGQFFAGTWESNFNSAAYVPPLKRRRYVHGAVWGGPRSEVLSMCQILSDRTISQLPAFPIWHDESFLNWFSSEYSVPYLPKHFSGAKSQIFSNTFRSSVLSEDKNQLDSRNRSQS
jgi:hypothetical protein